MSATMIAFMQLSSGVLPQPNPIVAPNDVPVPAPISPEEQAMLNQLADIDLPDPISWWPPSIIFCVLLVCLFLLSAVAVFFFIKHRRSNEYKRLALQELHKIEANIDQLDAPNTVFELTKLLKRTIYTFDAKLKNKIASLQGEAWFAYLDNTLKKQHNFKLTENHEALSLIEYAAPAAEDNAQSIQLVEAYKIFCRHWLQHHSKIQLYIRAEGSQ